ncbi:MAG: hypothetical protein M1399_07645 [Actinobacteria bacterium]|nr:hypothetical protein [Actinomycetota bacterium]
MAMRNSPLAAMKIPHGHLAAVSIMAKKLKLRELLGPACKDRDIAYALVLARVVHPRPKISSTKWWVSIPVILYHLFQ